MIAAVARVVRGEGVASAMRRASERIAESSRRTVLRARSAFARPVTTPVLNVSATPVVRRRGGVPVQLLARLEAERAFRSVALFDSRGLDLGTHLLRVRDLREAIAITGARAIHLEGTDGVDAAAILPLLREGVRLVVSVHDFTAAGSPLLEAATGLVFPSEYLRRAYGAEGVVIEPGVSAAARTCRGRAIAFAGSVRRDKGAHLLPEIVRGAPCRVFGGGDEEVLRELRRHRNLAIHGYYRDLPALLARHGIGLVIVPSMVPESFGLVLSEAWLCGAAVAAFDHGALAERIRGHGGGWLAPVESGAAGLASIVEQWIAGTTVEVPAHVPTALDAARAAIEQYRRWDLLPGA